MTGRRGGLAALLFAALLVSSGCLGALSDESTPETPTTDEMTAAKVIEEVQRKHENVTGFRATITQRTVVHLTNGSRWNRELTTKLAIDYSGDRTRFREVRVGPGGSRRVTVANATNVTTYDAVANEYQVRPRDGDGSHYGGSYSLDVAPWGTDLDALRKANNATYEGTATVADREAYVVSFTAARRANDSKSTPTSSFANQTFWFDTETGILLKHVTHKPVRQFNHTVREVRSPPNATGFGDYDGEDAVYLDRKVQTMVLSNVTVNPAFANETFTFDPPADATRIPVGGDGRRETETTTRNGDGTEPSESNESTTAETPATTTTTAESRSLPVA